MVALPQQYNVDDLDISGGPLPLIPPGNYKAVAVESEIRDNRKGTGKYVALKFVITEGQHQNTEFVERLNIINPNETAVRIAYETLGKICKALGMAKTPGDTTELHNKPLYISVATEEGTPWKDKDGVEHDGRDKSVIAGYKSLSTPVQSSPPQENAEQGDSKEQASAATQPAAPSTLPWAR